MFQSNLFQNKTALVTGGGSGIGYAITKQLLSLGAKVIITSRKEDKLQKATAELSAFGAVRYALCDIRDAEQVEALAQNIKANEGTIDILVNNAGGQFPSAAENISPKGFAAVVNNNLNGTWNVTHAIANHFFIPQKNGVIVNIIANMFRGFPGMAHTGAARAGVANLTMTLAVEWSKYNININAIAPGPFDTDMMAPTLNIPEFRQQIVNAAVQHRIAEPEELVGAALLLASDAGSYMTGSCITVDGGTMA